MGFFERHLFQGGREWVCSKAEGEVLEIAVGTGRNFSYYPSGIGLTGRGRRFESGSGLQIPPRLRVTDASTARSPTQP
jgi:hypothetical protein